MKAQENMEERLWEFIDGQGNPSQRSAIEELIATNQDWKRKYSELLEVHQLVQASELEAPSLRFTKNVMEEISRLQIAPATRNYINKRIVWGIGLFFITMVVGFTIYGFGLVDWKTSNNDSVISENLNKISFNNFFNNTWVTVFMMINVVLGLFLLDNYLTNKKNQIRKSA
jgi:hypothetical protein